MTRGRKQDPDIAAAVTNGDDICLRKKPCKKCDGHLFMVKNNPQRAGFRAECIGCRSERRQSWREANREKWLENTRRSNAKYRGTARGRARILSNCNKRRCVHTPLSAEDQKRLDDIYLARLVISKFTGVQHEVDHIVEVKDGGCHHPDNLQILHHRAHKIKGDLA